MSKLQDKEPARSSFPASRERKIQVQSMLSQVWNG